MEDNLERCLELFNLFLALDSPNNTSVVAGYSHWFFTNFVRIDKALSDF